MMRDYRTRVRAILAAAFLAAYPAINAETLPAKTIVPTAATVAPSAPASAVKPWPGRSIRTATALEGIASATSSEGAAAAGFGMRGTLAVEGLFARPLVLETSAGYRWISRTEGPLPLPGAALDAGWRYSLPGMFSVTPLAGVSLEAAFPESGAEAAFQISAGARFAFLLSEGDYLSVTPFASVPVAGPLSPSVSLAIGLRSENPWMLPMPNQKPSVRASPDLFSPDGDAVDDEVTFALRVRDRSLIARWSLTVYGSDNAVFRQWKGSGEPPRTIVWKGESDGKKTIEAGSEYRVSFETEDALGAIGKGETKATCDILVIKDGDRYKVRVSDINFPSDSWEVSPKDSRKLLEANRKTLVRIATLFSRFPDYSLTVEGYANAVYWSDAKKLADEQKKELIPLSQKRADAVKAALVMLGIDEKRIHARGLGGEKPVADFADSGSAWKNRRVEFILEKR